MKVHQLVSNILFLSVILPASAQKPADSDDQKNSIAAAAIKSVITI